MSKKQETEERISVNKVDIRDEIASSFAAYAKDVIMDRALPDIRDGLLPVQRRVIYGMHKMRLLPTNKQVKSARIVGEVMGKYHPHGDVALYGAMARMSKEWVMRHPLVTMFGNNGSVDGDTPAAMRYTEARLSKPAIKLLEGLSKQGVVDWQKNYDDALDEPQYLPAQFPNILVNGASGISVGYASDIPPHNLKEVLESCILILDDPTLTFEQLAIQGPDFPTGAEIINKNELARIYNVGEGSIRVRAKYYLEETSKRAKYNKLVFYEMPYNVKKPDVLLQIKTLLEQKLLNGVGSIMDDTNKEGTRLVLQIEKGVNHASLADVLYQKTSLQANVTYNCVVIADGKPRVLGINELLRRYNKFRIETVRRELEADNEVDRKRLHILDGMLILADNVKDIIAIIEKSKTKDESRQALIGTYQLSVEQANTILELQLHRINRASKEDFQTEHNQRTQQLAHRQNILNTKALLLQYVKDGYLSLIEEFKATTKRLTTVTSEEVKVNVDIESMIQLEDVAVGVTPDGYIKRSSIRSYQSTESAYNGFSLETNTHQHVLLFTNKGDYVYLPVHELKEGRWGDEGSHLSTMGVDFLEGEQIVSVSEYEEDALVFILRKSGTGKVSHAKDFPVSRHSAIYTCGGVEDGDEVYFAGLVSEQDTLAISTKQELKTKTKYGSFLLNIYDLAPIGVKAKGRKLVKLSKTKDIINCVTVQGDGEETKFNTGTNDIELTPILPYKLFNQQPNTLTDPQLLAPQEEPNESDLQTEESIQVVNQEQAQEQEED